MAMGSRVLPRQGVQNDAVEASGRTRTPDSGQDRPREAAKRQKVVNLPAGGCIGAPEVTHPCRVESSRGANMKVFISCGDAAGQVTALRLQALGAAHGLTVYVPPAYTRQGEQGVPDPAASRKLSDAEVLPGSWEILSARPAGRNSTRDWRSARP